MKLALLISSLYGGGAERVMATLANHWVAQGISVVLVTYERSAADYPLDRRVEHVSLDLNRSSPGLASALVNNCRRLAALRRTVRGAAPDAVISFEECMNASALIALAGLGIPCVVSERTDPRRHVIGPAWAFLRRLTYPFAAALVVQTAELREWGRKAMLGARRVRVIANPVREMEAFARARAAEGESPLVVGVGRLTAAKGFDVLLHAFASIAGDHPGWRLALVGEGPEREPLCALARELGLGERFTITGWLKEPADVVAGAGVYVLSSRYEGFPNALLEAMACGVPVVATRCAGATEIVNDGVDGLLVPIDAIPALAQAMDRLIRNAALRATLGVGALSVRERYSIEAIAERWDNVVAGVLPRASSSLIESRGK